MHLNKLNIGFLVTFLSFAAALPLPAATLNVPSEHRTILAALTAAREGDTVIVSAATYGATATGSSEGPYPIVVPPGVTLAGNGATPADTVIDAEGEGRILKLGAGAVVRNLTLANCRICESSATEESCGCAIDAREGALVENCIVAGGTADVVSTCEQYVYLDGATMRNSTICDLESVKETWEVDNYWNANTGVALLAVNGSLVEGVTVEDNWVVGGNCWGGWRTGAPVVLSASTIKDSVVRGNTQGYTIEIMTAGGIQLFAGARAVNTLVESNSVPGQVWGYAIGGIAAQDWENCLIDRCVIRHNTIGADCNGLTGIGGALVGNGTTMRNSLVAGNTVVNDYRGEHDEAAGGILMAVNSHLENCTVADNSYAGDGIYMCPSNEDIATIVNSIVTGNSLNENGSVGISYSLLPKEVGGEGNMTGDPLFADAANGDYTLTLRSPCVDTGAELEAVTVDLVGTARPQDGRKSGAARTDIGCYEFVPPSAALVCTLMANLELSAAPHDAVLTAEVIGDATGATYSWTCFRDGVEFAGQETSVPTCTFEGLGYGHYTFAVRVTNGAGDEATDATPSEKPLTVGPDTCYVSLAGSGEWPYDAPETATASIKDAIATAVRRVVILAGTYSEMEHVTDAETGLDLLAAVRRALALEGAGPDQTVFDCAGGGGFLLADPGARLTGLSIVNSCVTSDGDVRGRMSALHVADGVASNLVIRGGETYRGDGHEAVELKGGLLADSVITGFTYNDWGSGILEASAATLRNVRVIGNSIKEKLADASGATFENCLFATNAGSYGILAAKAGSTLADCTFADNASDHQAFTVEDAAFRRCQIVRTTVGDRDAASLVEAKDDSSNLFENCLIADNISKGEHGIVFLSPGDSTLRMVNTTVAGNTAVSHSAGVFAGTHPLFEDYRARFRATNCIFGDNLMNGETCDIAGDSPDIAVTYSCYAAAEPTEENHNLNDAPRFRTQDGQPYQLSAGSPCRMAGDASVWEGSENPTDILGVPRLDETGRVDMGCYEFVQTEDPLVCELSVSAEIAAAPAAVTLSAVVTGTRTTGLAYAWICTRTYRGETSSVTNESGEASCTFADLGYGEYAFAVKVTNDWGDEVTTVAERPTTVCAATTYVSPTGGDVWPYDNEANAARNFADAIGAAVERVVVLAGDYSGMEHADDEESGLDVLAAIRRPVSVEGAGPDATVVDCAERGGFLLADPGARLTGLSIVNACVSRDEEVRGRMSALHVSSGVASNLVIRGGETFRGNVHEAVELKGGLLADSVITGFAYNDWGSGVVEVSAGTMRGVRVVGNRLHDTLVIASSGATLENCLFATNASHYGLLSIGDSTAVGCIFADNTSDRPLCLIANEKTAAFRRCQIVRNEIAASEGAGGAVVVANDWCDCRFENCLIADNVSKGEHGIVFLSPGEATLRLVNTTVAGNTAVSHSAGVFAGTHPLFEDYRAHVQARNCVLAGNLLNGEPCDIAGDSPAVEVTYSCYAAAEPTEENHNLNVDPKLRSRKGMPYQPSVGSPCRNAGDASVWGEVAEPTDLIGAPRLDGKGRVDMGCYQTTVRGMAVFIR